MLQAIVKLLVIAKVEAQLLQFPLEIPIRFSDKEKAGVSIFDRGDHFSPILGLGRHSGTSAPGALKDCVQEQHGHVTANAVALFGNAGEGFNRGLSQAGLKSV